MTIYIDIKMEADSNGMFDIDIENGKISMDDGFDTVIYNSLLTDQRASESQVKNPRYRRGWLGDLYQEDGRKIGSLLWLLEQRRLTQSTLNEAINYTEKALQWMIDDKIVTNIEVSGEIVPGEGISISVTLTSDDTQVKNKFIQFMLLTGV